MAEPSPAAEPELLGFFKALGQESRLRLIGLVAQQERSVGELARLAGLTEPTVSHHIAVLRAAGLVRQREDGATRWCALDVEGLERLARRILSPGAVESLAPPAPRDDGESAVLQAFVGPDGRLTRIPASRKKRWITLAWMVRQLPADREIPERELNALLAERHPDVATIRREFIGYRMMSRADGVYRRLPETDWVREAPQV